MDSPLICFSFGSQKTLMAKTPKCAAGGLDRISSLSDDLLRTILKGLHSAAEAARTSVLSRRWRAVWTGIPDLIFLEDVASPDAVDRAIAAYAAPAVDRFAVGLTDMSRPVTAARAAAWLRFAAARAAREVHLVLPAKQPPPRPEDDVEEELEVPPLEAAVWLNLNLVYDFRLRLPPAPAGAGAAAFGQLRVLSITRCRASGADLSRVVSEQCPSLWVLELSFVDADGDLSIRSDTLERLALRVAGIGNRIDVVAPSLEWIQVHGCNTKGARITAPKLTEVEWDDVFDPALHLFLGTGRRLRRLAVTQWVWDQPPPLLQRFDEADELSLHLMVAPFPRAYPLFIENTSKLPKSKALTVGIKIRGHALRSSLLHLLRKCGGITKLEIELIPTDKVSLCDLFRCDCVQSEALRTDNVTLNSLEQVEFYFFTDDDVDLAKMMFMCKNTIKKMVINVPDDVPLSKEVREKIQSFSHPRTTLKIGGPSSHKRNACQCSEHDWY